mgnify:FL=1
MELTKELVAKAKEAKTSEELMALAKEAGIELTEESAALAFEQLNSKTSELSDSELDNVSGGCGGGYDAGRPHPQFAVGETVLYIHSWLGATRITATGKVVKRNYENGAWYYTLKIHDGSTIKMVESHVMKC